MILRVLDPTNEMKAAGVQPAARPSSLAGAIVGIISNGKEGTKDYFAQLERMLRGMDVVQREEFEAVKEMAAKARAENETLTARVSALEAELAATKAG